MDISIKPSDLYYRYPRKKETRDIPKFSGKPDANHFDRYDLYEVIPMYEAVMNALGSCDNDVFRRWKRSSTTKCRHLSAAVKRFSIVC